MRNVGVRELKNSASEVIRAVREERAEYVVTYRGRPVAVILPVGDADRDDASEGILAAKRAADELSTRLAALREEIESSWESDRSAVDLLSESRR